jgi:hypothetical protein
MTRRHPRTSDPQRGLDLSLMRLICQWVDKVMLIRTMSVVSRELLTCSATLVREVQLGRLVGKVKACKAALVPSRLVISSLRFTAIRRLDLGGCGLTSLPDEVWSLRNVEALRLSSNNLTSLPKAVTRLAKLIVLRVSKNKLRSLPKELFTECAELTMLLADSNQITKLPETLGNAKHMSLLHVERNLIERVPRSIGQLRALTDLYLGENALVELPATIGSCANLVRFSIYGNKQLNALPLEITLLKTLEMFDLPVARLRGREPAQACTRSPAIRAWLAHLQANGCCVR